MTTHILSLTYKPKIDPVFKGQIRQTIRTYNPGKPKMPGDKILLHEWTGKPYRSPWGRRFEGTVAETIILQPPSRRENPDRWIVLGVNGRWTDNYYLTLSGVIDITLQDGIVPCNIYSLWDVLNDLSPNGIPKLLEVIRW